MNVFEVGLLGSQVPLCSIHATRDSTIRLRTVKFALGRVITSFNVVIRIPVDLFTPIRLSTAGIVSWVVYSRHIDEKQQI